MPEWQGVTQANLFGGLPSPCTPAVSEGQPAGFCPVHRAPAAGGAEAPLAALWEKTLVSCQGRWDQFHGKVHKGATASVLVNP